MKVLDVPKSGRCGDLVFYRVRRRQFARRYVVPALRRTPATARARGSLGALSKMWRTLLTEEQRRGWNGAAAKVQSRPRLEQAGPLTGQAHFVGINSSRARINREVLLVAPERVSFPPSPVTGLILCRANGQVSLKLSVSGPVTEDIMVFGAAPCSAGRKKWRHGAFLGLLPTPVGGESGITELYLARYGEPEPGKRVFIRTRQQRDGWEGHPRDVSDVVVAKPTAAGVEIRSPKAEIRPAPLRQARSAASATARQRGERKSESRSPKWAWAGRVGQGRCTREQYRIYTVVSPGQCRASEGGEWGMRSAECGTRTGGEARGRRKGHWRELWRGS